ncbi:MAG TPA: flagellar hook-length control protein FliK [Bordetella sp.]
MNKPFSPRPRSKAGRPQETALSWLGHDTRGAGVLATAQRHLQIQQALAALLPPGLGEVCAVIKLDNQRLELAVPGSAYAAKLRQMAPSLAQALATRGWLLNEIAVRIQAGMPRPGSRAARLPKTVQPLGADALQAFDDLGKSVRPGPLADAIARLLAHHKKGS